MLIPYNTDAPIYHWPIATVGMIVLNTIIFFGTALPEPEPEFQFGVNELSELAEGMKDDEELQALLANIKAHQGPKERRHPWTLWYGDGWHPTQWVTSNFMHVDFFHLLGNMFFLWAFGLVIEGKLGWWRFLLVYLGVGVAQCALEQTIMAAIPSAAGQQSLGASAAIFGLLAMALIWAPKNEMQCVFIYYYPITFEMPIYLMAVIGTGLEFLSAALGGFGMSSAILHLMGAGFGLAIGIVMLKLNWVDCENWDVFSLRKDRSVKLLGDIRAEQRALREELLEKGEAPAGSSETQDERRREAAQQHIAEYLDAGAHQPAAALFWETDRTCQGWQLPEAEHLRLIIAFHRAGQDRESIPLMTRYLRDHAGRATQVRLKLASLLIHQEQRPAKALRVLERIPYDQLTPRVSQHLARLRADAARQIAEGALELEDDGDV